jgi:hypothetical protein
MQQIFNYDDDYSSKYRSLFAEATRQSKELGFIRDPLISEKTAVSNDMLRKVSHFLNEFSELLDQICPSYWGNSCQTLSTNIFAYLNAQGIVANIVIGNVIINGTDEFDTTIETIKNEILATEPLVGHQSVHAWVSLGDDTIIDPALPPRLVKNYGLPEHFNDVILIGRASEFSVKYKLRYQPIVVGTEFFAKTNPPDPMELLIALKRRTT